MTTGKTPMIDENGDVRELKRADFKRARKASDVFPGSLQAKLGMRAKGDVLPEEGPDSSSSLKVSAVAAPARKVEKDIDDEIGFHRVAAESLRSFRESLKASLNPRSWHFSQPRSRSTWHEHPDVTLAFGVAEHVNPYHLDNEIYQVLVTSVASKYSVGVPEAHFLAGAVPSLELSWENMTKREMVGALQMQTELLERLKTLVVVVGGEDAQYPQAYGSQLTGEVHKAMLAKRLRDLAEEVEMSGGRSREASA